jgi:hypothetical protein
MPYLSGNLGIWRRTFWYANWQGRMQRVVFCRSTGHASKFILNTWTGFRGWVA